MATATDPATAHISIQASKPWREWLRGLAGACRTDASKVVDQALAELAERRGHPAPPPRWPERAAR